MAVVGGDVVVGGTVVGGGEEVNGSVVSSFVEGRVSADVIMTTVEVDRIGEISSVGVLSPAAGVLPMGVVSTGGSPVVIFFINKSLGLSSL